MSCFKDAEHLLTLREFGCVPDDPTGPSRTAAVDVRDTFLL